MVDADALANRLGEGSVAEKLCVCKKSDWQIYQGIDEWWIEFLRCRRCGYVTDFSR